MDKNLRSALRGVLALSILGWVNALFTLVHRQKLFAGGLDAPSFCNVSSAFNCDAVALSDYSSVAGFPTSAIGMFFYSLLFMFALWGEFSAQDGKEAPARAATALAFLASALALVPTFALAGISFFVLKMLCLMCLATYLLNILIFAFTAKAFRAAKSSFAIPAALGEAPQALVVLAVVSLALHALAPRIVENSVAGGTIDDKQVRTFVLRHQQSPQRNILLDGYPSQGPKDAPITLVEYSDLQCPYCRHANITLPQVLGAYGNKVRVVFKHFPLDSNCNPTPGMHSGGHPFACEAAKTGYCVFKEKGDQAFFAYVDAVFEKQSSLGSQLIRDSALAQGVTAEKIQECVNDRRTHEAILTQAAEGNAVGVQGTPSIYINGRSAEGAIYPKILKADLDSYLKHE